MNVILNLKRATSKRLLREFRVPEDFPKHCESAAITLFLADVLSLQNERDVASDAVAKLSKVCLMRDKVLDSKLAGGTSCSLRVAAFTAMLAHLWSQRSPGAMANADVLRWAAEHCLHGNIRDRDWTLTDVMFALDSLVCHWESLCSSLWQTQGCFRRDDMLQRYLDLLWLQCARFVVGTADSELLDSSTHTLPYPRACRSAGESEYETSVSPGAVVVMCEVWRSVERQRRVRWQLEAFKPLPNAEAVFSRVFRFERNQLTVDKFRENLRARLAKRHLALGDAAIWSAKNGGKDPEIDLVVGDRCPFAMQGYVQQAASAWTYEKMTQHEVVRDELYRGMTDSYFQSRTQLDFSCRFFEDADDDPKVPRRGVTIVKRICHGFAVVVCDAEARRTATTPPLTFAHALLQWASAVAAMPAAQYGEDVVTVTRELQASCCV